MRSASYRLSSIIFAAAGMQLSGCATLPSNGPTAGQVIHGAGSQSPGSIPYTVVDIDKLGMAASPPARNSGLVKLSSFATEAPSGRTDMVRVGDTLTISIFEVGVSLFNPAQNIADSTGRAPTANAQQVVVTPREDGMVELPYIGVVRAVGAYPEELAEVIRLRLRRLSESPDVQVTISDTLRNTVYVSGSVARPGRYRLTSAGERLLDVVALAGGAAVDVNEVEVKLVRGDRTAAVLLNELDLEDPANLTLLPGDRLELVRKRKSFTVFGATDKVSQVPFESRNVNLAEAVARVAGPSDSRANPRGVFVFRLEADEGGGAPRATVYRLNMLKPESYFVAQMFEMRDKDVILFANSTSNMTAKLTNIINQLFSPALAVRYATQ